MVVLLATPSRHLFYNAPTTSALWLGDPSTNGRLVDLRRRLSAFYCVSAQTRECYASMSLAQLQEARAIYIAPAVLTHPRMPAQRGQASLLDSSSYPSDPNLSQLVVPVSTLDLRHTKITCLESQFPRPTWSRDK